MGFDLTQALRQPALRIPTGVSHDGSGNVFISDYGLLRRVDPKTGVMTTLYPVPQRDLLILPEQVAAAPDGTAYVADSEENAVIKVTPERVYTTVVRNAGYTRLAGSPAGTPAMHTDTGPPTGVARDAAGNLYISGNPEDYIAGVPTYRAQVFKLTPDGVLHLIAGGAVGFSGDGGPAVKAQLTHAGQLAVASDGSLFIADYAEGRVRRVSPSGIITTVAGGGTVPAGCDGLPAFAAKLVPTGVAVDRQGRLLLSDDASQRVLRVETDGTLTTVLGNGQDGPTTDGTAAVTNPAPHPTGLDVLADGTLLVAEDVANQVVAVTSGTAPGVLTATAGTGLPGHAGDGGAACGAQLAYPKSVARAQDGSVYVADYLNSAVRRISPAGTISTIVGGGRIGDAGDGGPGTAALLNRPRSVAVDPAGRLLIADTGNSRIRRWDPATGIVTTIAGTGGYGYGGDGGPARAARLARPQGVTAGADGGVWIADTDNARLRRIDPADNSISTPAGTGTPGVAGDGGAGTAAQLTSPRSVAVSSTGNAVYVSDPGSSSVRRLDLATGRISTPAGPGTGQPLNNPAGLLDTPHGLLIAEAGADRVLRLDPTGTITTLAGTTPAGSTSSGQASTCSSPAATVPARATATALCQPQGLSTGPNNTILIADTGHNRLLKLTQ